jgi:hypothetical protein
MRSRTGSRERKAVTPTPKIRPEVHRRFERVLARVNERDAAGAAEIERRILALPNLDARQPRKRAD